MASVPLSLFHFAKAGVKNKVLSYSNALKVDERRAKRVAKSIVDSFTFEEIIVDL